MNVSRFAILFTCCSVAVVNGQAPITCVRVTADGHTLVSTTQNRIQVANWDDLAVRTEVEWSSGQIYDIQFSVDESVLFAAGGEPGERGVVTAYTWPKLTERWRAEVSEDVIYSVAVAMNGQQAAAAAHDHSVYLLNANTGTGEATLSDHSRPVVGVLYLNGNRLVTCSLDQSIRVWNQETQSVIRSLNNHTQPVTEMALRRGGTGIPMVVSGSEDKTIRLWQPTIGRMVRFHRFRTPVQAVAFTPDGEYVVCGCRDGSVRLTNISTLDTKTVATACRSAVVCLAIHPGEDVAVTGCSDGTLQKVKLAR